MRVLFVTNDRVGRKRAGPAIRCVELAKALALHYEVTLAATQSVDIEIEGVQLLPDVLKHPELLRAVVTSHDVVIVQGLVLAIFPFLNRLAKYLVVDLYDPYLLEYLSHSNQDFRHWGYLRQWQGLNRQLLRGDFFICASDRQRDYWLGRLCALGRLTPEVFQRDPTFKSLVAVVPFGISKHPPRHTQDVAKGVMPGFSSRDYLLLWAGGIWQWFDPLTVIRAMGLISQERTDIKLLFLGTIHPNPDVREMPILKESQALARNLGVLDRTVFFKEGWVPFEERQNFLVEADLGVSAHLETFETRLAFRTRVLDYIWGGLPMILSEGDYLADWVAREKVGVTLQQGDVEGWKAAILSMAGNPELSRKIRNELRRLSAQFYWERLAEPLVTYCRQPYSSRRTSLFQMSVVPLLSAMYEQFRRLKGRWR